MDIFKLVLGIIGFTVIILTALLVIRPTTTGDFVLATGMAVVDVDCPGRTSLNGGCVDSTPEPVSSNDDIDVFYDPQKQVLGLGGETKVDITILNKGDGKNITPLPPIMRRNGQVINDGDFTLNMDKFELFQSYSKKLTLEMKVPKQESLHGKYELITPFKIVEDGTIAYNILSIDVGLPLNKAVRLLEGQKLSEMQYYSNVRPCEEAYIIIIDPPTLFKKGEAEIIVPFCNYGNYEDGYLVSGVTMNYDYYKWQLTECVEDVRIMQLTGEFNTPYRCNVPIYNECSGALHLIATTSFPEETDSIENNGWLISKEGYCFLEPHNAFLEGLSFNDDVNDPVITASVRNRFGVREITVDFIITNTDGDEVTICTDTQTYGENELKDIDCEVRRNGLPYSFWGDGFLGEKDDVITAVITSDEYAGDNSVSIPEQPVFEFINVGIVDDSLTASRHAEDHYAMFSFQIENIGDKVKSVDYWLRGKYICDLEDPLPKELEVCSGTVNVNAGEVQNINCNLAGRQLTGCVVAHDESTIINCDLSEPRDGCNYDGSMITLSAEIQVEHQEASAFNAQERILSNKNSFIVPIFERVGVIEFTTPRLPDE
jgi:hypothetical protein